MNEHAYLSPSGIKVVLAVYIQLYSGVKASLAVMVRFNCSLQITDNIFA